jgi:hypothetical protein
VIEREIDSDRETRATLMHACCDIIHGYRLSATTGWSGVISTILLLALQYTGR